MQVPKAGFALFLLFVLVVATINAAGNERRRLPSDVHLKHEIDAEWEAFLELRNAQGLTPYASAEETAMRFGIFRKNFVAISEHNKRDASYKMAINKFADRTQAEWKAMVAGQKQVGPVDETKFRKVIADERLCNKKPPTSMTWKQVTSPRDQGQFGAAGLFATIESIVDAYVIKYGESTDPSMQELIDCASSADFPTQFYEWIIQQGGIDTEDSYPYTNDPGQCKPTNQYAAQLTGYTTVQSGNETELACAVAFYEPVAVCVDASHTSFQFYSGGIYYEPNCATNNPDHCMMVTGYGSLGAGKDYWLVENSWGVDWGLNGYIWMARDRKNNCGIASYAAFPLIK